MKSYMALEEVEQLRRAVNEGCGVYDGIPM